MDLFAVILITITATTICGICLFIFICAVHPRFLRKLHGKTSRTNQDPDSNENENEDEISINSLDDAMESRKSITPSTLANNRDKRTYLKSLERSIRTGRPIQDEDNANYHENDSPSTPLKFIRHCINKHIRRKTSDTFESTEI